MKINLPSYIYQTAIDAKNQKVNSKNILTK